MLLQGDHEEKNRGLWKIGVVKILISGKDEVVRGAILKTGNGRKERPLQRLYPLELSKKAECAPLFHLTSQLLEGKISKIQHLNAYGYGYDFTGYLGC